VYKEPSKATEY